VRVRLAAAAAGLIVIAVAGAASAAPPPGPVQVWRGSDGSVCFVISKQVPHCVPVPVQTGR